MTRYVLPMMLLACCLYITGCKSTDDGPDGLVLREKKSLDGDTTQHYLTFHSFDTQDDPNVHSTPIEYQPGRIIYLHPVPHLSSRYITKIETITVRDGVALRCFVDSAGLNQWTVLSGTYRDQLMVLMVDGKFRSFLKIRDFSKESTFELAGPFDPEEAAGIVQYAPVNYLRGLGEKID